MEPVKQLGGTSIFTTDSNLSRIKNSSGSKNRHKKLLELERVRHGFIEFTVFDTGEGIENKKLENIFAMFEDSFEES